MTDLMQMMKRQRVLADFGEFALRSQDLDAVLTEACRLVAAAVGTDRAKILEIQDGGDELLVRAGVGWALGVVGQVRLPMSELTSESFSIRAGEPVIAQNIEDERRFDVPEFMKQAGVVALVNVPIFVPGREPYGLLQVDAQKPRTFGQNEVEFLRTYATILGPVIDRLRKLRRLKESEDRFRLIMESVRDYAILTTDAQGRIDGWFPGAEAVFGWTPEEALGCPAAMTFTPEDRAAGESETEAEVVRREGVASDMRWHLRKDGSRVLIEGTVRALRDRHGEVRGFVKVGQDVTKRCEAEDRIRRSEGQLAAIFAQASVGLCEIDGDGRFRRVNAELCRILGRPEAELLRLGVEDVTCKSDLPAWFEALKRAGETGSSAFLERTYRRPDGFLVWAHSSITPLGVRDGIALFLVVTADLTERRAAEDARRESEARLAAALESVPVGIAVIDLTGRIVLSNREYRRFLPSGLIPSRDPERGGRWRAWDKDCRLIEPGNYPGARAMRGERTVPGLEMLYTDDDGREIWTSMASIPIFDEDGHVTGQASVISDIDASKRGTVALRQSEARLRTLVEGIPQLVWRAEHGGRWTWASPQWTAYTGLSDADSLGWGWLEALHPEDRDLARAAWGSAEAGRPLSMEARIRNVSENRYGWFQSRATPVRGGNGTIAEWLGTSTDVDGLRAFQERQKVLVAELQHRTRNLIAVVRSIFQQTVRTSGTLEEFEARFDDQMTALARVQGLLSRADQDKITIGTLVRTELQALGAGEGDGRVTLRGPEVPLRNATVQTLALALHELATNARKYGALASDRGRLAVEWSLENDDTNRQRLILKWAEAGVDMAGAQGGLMDQRTGYGRELIERAVPYALGAKTTYEMAEDGIRCTVDLPLHKRSPQD